MTKILIVEDEEQIRINYGEFLELAGFQTLGADNGIVGVNMAKQYLPDLIICDIMMPGLDGYEVLLQLRSDPVTANIPFIFLTAKADKPFMRQGMELGADDYLTKPISGTELVSAVNARLQRKSILEQEYTSQMDNLRTSLISSLPNMLHAPLTGILGHASLLKANADNVTPKRINHLTDAILNSAQLLQHQIENYLFYSQLEILSTEPDRIAELLNTVTVKPGDQIAKVASEKAIHWKRENDLTIDVTNAPIPIATVHLEKIAEELIDNAFKFSDPGTPVQVKVDSDDDVLAFFISNQGQGMAQEHIKNVGAYMRFPQKLEAQYGAGLGLIIAKRLVELHNAVIMISSVSGENLTICVEFPLADRKHA